LNAVSCAALAGLGDVLIVVEQGGDAGQVGQGIEAFLHGGGDASHAGGTQGGGALEDLAASGFVVHGGGEGHGGSGEEGDDGLELHGGD
jgi:hypothetical protein